MIFTPSGDLVPIPQMKTYAPDEAKHDQKEFNSYGYRADEFDTRHQGKKVLSIGCSWTFGIGLEKRDRWSDIVCDKLNALNWNFGSSGSSNDYISRICLSTIPELKPDLVVVLFTRHVRREFVNSEKYIKYIPAWRKWPHINSWPFAIKVFKALDVLCSHENDIANFYWNYKFLESYFHKKKQNWIFSWIPCDEYGKYGKLDEEIKSFIDHEKWIGEFPFEDLASDNSHPGVLSNRLFADKVIKKIEQPTKLKMPIWEDIYHDPHIVYRDKSVEYQMTNPPNNLIEKEIKKAWELFFNYEKSKIHKLQTKFKNDLYLL